MQHTVRNFSIVQKKKIIVLLLTEKRKKNLLSKAKQAQLKASIEQNKEKKLKQNPAKLKQSYGPTNIAADRK